jgi:hypothetical protein
MNVNKLLIALFVSVIFLGVSCKKTPDQPPVKILTNSSIVTIDSLRKWQEANGGAVLIEDSLSVYGIVTMDESDGNIYKNIYLQDDSAAINVRFTASSDLIVGDSIRISLIGCTLNEYNGVIQLDGVDPKERVIVQAKNQEILPLTLKITEIDITKHESKLIKLENIQFKNSELNSTFADAINQASMNRYFEDWEGNNLFIRTSGFAEFAGDSLPKGSGSMVCIVSEYNGEVQLIVRSPEEVIMNGARGPGEFLTKNFDDNNLTSGGWSVVQVVGAQTWEIGELGSWADKPYAVISNYDGVNTACESWLISPAMDFSSSVDANLSFDNAYKYSGDPLSLLISIDYTGTGDPNLATWTSLTAIWSGGDFDFVNSGLIDLSAFLTGNVHVAFKYTGSDADGRTWEIDNIVITA